MIDSLNEIVEGIHNLSDILEAGKRELNKTTLKILILDEVELETIRRKVREINQKTQAIIDKELGKSCPENLPTNEGPRL